MTCNASSCVFGGRQAQGFHDAVVDRGLYVPDLVVIGILVGSIRIGQQDDEEILLRVDPDGGAREAGVPEALVRKIMAARRRLCGHIPA